MINLDNQQRQVVITDSDRALVLAGAGSGKTRVLTERIAHLIENKQVSPYEIMAFTFTRKSAGEIINRLADRIGNMAYNVTMGTMHGVALNMIQKFAEMIGFRHNQITVYSQWEEDFLLKEIAIDLGYHTGKSWKKIKKSDVTELFDGFYNRGIYPQPDAKAFDLFKCFMAAVRSNNSLTYGTILTEFKRLVPIIKPMLNIKYALVDEVQDIDPLQWSIINMLTEDKSLFAVGDLDQCQPAGTMIETTTGFKSIETLDQNKDELYSYCKHDAMVYGGHNKGYKFQKSMRVFSGLLYTVESGGNSTKCTGNHKWYVKWSKDIKNTGSNIVYLMKRGDRYRIGWCQLFKKEKINSFHLSVRSRLEKADASWIIKIFDNKKDASIWESILSCEYGIPTITFEDKKNTEYYDKDSIDTVFDSIGDLTEKAERLLLDHGLDIKYPFHSVQRMNEKRSGTCIFEIEACNMFSGFFQVPMRKDGGRFIKWDKAIVSSERVRNVDVYSLNVEKNHTYIADGLCTKNCIYEFRGADPGYLLRNAKDFDIYKIEKNYRSGAAIVAGANRLISHNKDRFDKTMETTGNICGIVKVMHEMDSELLCENIRCSLTKNIAVLSRNHVFLEKISSILSEKEINHTYVGKKTSFVNSESFRRFHAFLKLMINPYDNFSFLIIRDSIGLSRDDYNMVRHTASLRGCSHFQAWDESKTIGVPPHSFVDIFDEISSRFNISGENLYQIESFMLDWYLSSASSDTESDIKNYLKFIATYNINEEAASENPEGIQLMTIHASKGLEFPTVVIAGCNEGILPSKRAESDPDELESERRLAYVGWTRAKELLVLAVRPEQKEAASGMMMSNPVSRFIAESY